MRIAVASSGLGRTSRGIETWARDTAFALAEQDADVTLFAGGEVEGPHEAASPRRQPNVVAVPCLQRGNPAARRLAALAPSWTWRWGLKSGYGWEQLAFWRRLWRRLRDGSFDILHVQDPMLAYWCRAFRRRGLLRTREILAHGTEEPIEFIERFDCVQHLTPWHMDQALQALRAMSPAASAPPAPGSTIPPHWVAIPNFVDTDVFAPLAADGDARRAAVRAAFGAPSRAFVVGCVAAVKKHHKRMDYLIGEFAEFRPGMPGSFSRPEPWLVIAGAKEDDSEELRALGEAFAPGRTRILLDLPRGRMPDLYRAMDVFVLTSLFEMMPISLLEALASGVPALTHQHPVFEWIAGDGGARLDMARPGALAGFIRQLTAGWLREHGQQARQRAVRMFSKSVAIGQYMDYYREVAAHVSP